MCRSQQVCCGIDSGDATADGPVDISNIKIGDEVFAFNEKTGETDLYPVTATFKHLDPEIIEVTIDDETITTTPGHLFYTNEGWVAAGDLVVGDDIHSLNGDDGTVTAIEIVSAQQWMYDLTVDEAHTFFVGDGWLVHNKDRCRIVFESETAAQREIEARSDVRANSEPNLIEENRIAVAFGFDVNNKPMLPEALMELEDGSFLAYEVKNQNQPDIGHAVSKFESVIPLAEANGRPISKLEIFIPSRATTLGNVYGMDVQGYLIKFEMPNIRFTINDMRIKVNIRNWPVDKILISRWP